MYDAQDSGDHNPQSDAAKAQLGQGISKLAFEIVDTAGMLEDLNSATENITGQLGSLTDGAARIGQAVDHMAERLDQIDSATAQSRDRASDVVTQMRHSSENARTVAAWVTDLSQRMKPLEDSLNHVRKSAERIAGIATEVNILAINARIEAARAGEEGRGFAVVAESIGQLSQQTAEVTKTITEEISGFSTEVTAMKSEAEDMGSEAEVTIETAERSDKVLAEIASDMTRTAEDVQAIAEEARVAGDENEAFAPVLSDIASKIAHNVTGIRAGHQTLNTAADRVERIVQTTIDAGIPTEDVAMITRVQGAAAEISTLFECAITDGRIDLSALFDTSYQPIPNTNPQQVLTRFTELTDALLPAIQERMLDSDPRVVFCAAVDRSGYLATHNKKFSQPQSDDPIWNAANCRNRRIFDDRVGLKAGQSTAPFLLQVYRRDMGGGNMVMMKDLSSPITVQGKHWGGLRLAYKQA
ncbi:MAG: methyl-accepting chemotaxis protein [Pseudomonadota bacterium]